MAILLHEGLNACVIGALLLSEISATSLPLKKNASSSWVMENVTVGNDMAVVVATLRNTGKVISLAVAASVAGVLATSCRTMNTTLRYSSGLDALSHVLL